LGAKKYRFGASKYKMILAPDPEKAFEMGYEILRYLVPVWYCTSNRALTQSRPYYFTLLSLND